jgi:hypothetical protein
MGSSAADVKRDVGWWELKANSLDVELLRLKKLMILLLTEGQGEPAGGLSRVDLDRFGGIFGLFNSSVDYLYLYISVSILLYNI